MIIVNYTPDDLPYVHGGIPGVLKSGEMTDMPEPKANFILNKYDQKGILKLQFGDDPEAKKAEAMRIWKAFWTRQIVIHNQANQKREARNLEYSEATDEVKEHAERLNIKLLGPWTVHKDNDDEVDRLKGENSKLQVQINALNSQLGRILGALESKGLEGVKLPEQIFSEVKPESKEPEKESEEDKIETESDIEEKLSDVGEKEVETALTNAEKQIKKGPTKDLVKELENIAKNDFVAWVMDHTNEIMNDYNLPDQAFVRETWNKLCTEDWPLPN